MKYNRPNIYDMIESLSLEEKKYLVGYLLDSIRKTEEIVPSLTCLEEQWAEIRRQIDACGQQGDRRGAAGDDIRVEP